MFKHIPNALTVFRILLVPLFVYLAAAGRLYEATVVFAGAGATDALDGFIARRFGLRTELGTNLDPLADKFLLVSAFIMLAYTGLIPVWLCAFVIIRDAVILSGVLLFRAAGRYVAISPTISGKITTILQVSTVLMAMVSAGRLPGLFNALAAVTLAFTVYTGFDYARREIRIQKRRG